MVMPFVSGWLSGRTFLSPWQAVQSPGWGAAPAQGEGRRTHVQESSASVRKVLSEFVRESRSMSTIHLRAMVEPGLVPLPRRAARGAWREKTGTMLYS